MNGKKRDYNQRTDRAELARCGMCYEQMLFIYDRELRDYCHECLMEPVFDESHAYEAYREHAYEASQEEARTPPTILSLV